ncbi:SDR family NAD(P)-dependent oxidoreductase [Thermoactinomyces mirandus]|uniref:SDR family NAD(P)-dependent oxidoreductase n=1 Tax=Thermoactinomyces mirandus TaxID=2756294 RepID=UPI0028A7CC71|nr:SDR family oxidoreductase [Thermoactinomyces mirandus]
MDVCFYGVFHLVRTFMPEMIERKQGKFVNIVGDSARTGDRNLILSAAARGGTISFLKSLAQEVGKYHIQCNTVALGLIGKDQPSIDSAIMTRIIKHYPLRRLGKIEDVTGMVLFLLSSRSDWMTGQSLPLTEDTVCLANCSIQFSGKKS